MLSAEQWQQFGCDLRRGLSRATSQPKLNSFEQSDREEAVECWLDSYTVADAWDLAPALVNARVEEGDLERVRRTVPAQDLENAIQWLAANLTTRDLLKSITHSTGAHLGIGGCSEVLLVHGPGAMARNRRA